MGGITDVLVTAVLAMVKIFLVLAVGVLCAVYPKGNPLLCRDGIRKLSRLSNYVFLPFLVASAMGSTIKPSKLNLFPPLIITQMLAFFLSLSMASLCERLFGINRAMFKPLKLAIAFPNAGTLPLLLMEALCEQPLVNSGYSSSAQCFQEATGQIFIYLIGWHVWFFCWGFYKLGECQELDVALPTLQGQSPTLAAPADGTNSSCRDADAAAGRCAATAAGATAAASRLAAPPERQLHRPSLAMTSLHDVIVQRDRPSPPALLPSEAGSGGGGGGGGGGRTWGQIIGGAGGRVRRTAVVAERSSSFAEAFSEDGDDSSSLDATQASPSPLYRDKDRRKVEQLAVVSVSSAVVLDDCEATDVLRVMRSVSTDPLAPCAGGKAVATNPNAQRGRTNSSGAYSRDGGNGRSGAGSGGGCGRSSLRTWRRIGSLCKGSKGGSSDGRRGGGGGTGTAAVALYRIKTALLSPPLIAVGVGVTIGLVPWLQNNLFFEARSPLRPVGAAMTALGTPLVALQTLIQAGSLLHTRSSLQQQQGGAGSAADGFGLPKRQFVMAGAVFVLCPLVVVPAVGFALAWLCLEKTSLLGESQLMQLVLLIELAQPSAQLIIVTLAQHGLSAMAGHVASMYLWQYAVSAFTLTAFSALAMHIVFSGSGSNTQ